MQSAQTAAKAFDDIPVRVIDSRSITSGLGTQVHAGRPGGGRRRQRRRHRRPGRGPDPPAPTSSARSTRSRTSRRAAASAAPRRCIGSVLSIKPMLDMSTGAVEEAGKARTRRKALPVAPRPHPRRRRHRAPGGRARRGTRRRRLPRPDRRRLPARPDRGSARSGRSSAPTPGPRSWASPGSSRGSVERAPSSRRRPPVTLCARAVPSVRPGPVRLRHRARDARPPSFADRRRTARASSSPDGTRSCA